MQKVQLSVTFLVPRGFTPEIKAKVIELYNQGMSIRSAANILGGSQTSALNWIKEFAKNPGAAILIELDEIWHYLGSKKNKLWIWKAYGREIGELVDWECDARYMETLRKLMNRLSCWDVELFCTDNWAVYSEVIGEDKLNQSKTQTFYLEQKNGRQRHGHARFRRKSIVV